MRKVIVAFLIFVSSLTAEGRMEGFIFNEQYKDLVLGQDNKMSVIAKIGKPYQVSGFGESYGIFTLRYNNNDVLAEIVISDQNYFTSKEISLGSTRTAVEKAYGKSNNLTYFDATKQKGLSFRCDSKNKVILIVFSFFTYSSKEEAEQGASHV